ncbi:hypothetical protein HDU91_004108, partial [Kappamyces sp. JEL0680]
VPGGLLTGPGLTPAMGWNSWNLYECRINEEIVKNITDALVRTGLRDLGYQYVVIDDCWQTDRTEEGTIVVDKERFPSGMKALSDYIHGQGLLFGIYSSAGTHTCQGRPGSLGFEEKDAQQYADWEVDFLKYDNCWNNFLIGRDSSYARYKAMGDALNKTGRPI